MKKINLIEWLSRNSHEKQKPQRFRRYAVMLIMLLTLGVGQMWADNAGLKDCYLRYSKNGSETTVTTSEGTTTGTESTLNEVTSLSITGIWIKNWTNSGTGISGNQVCYMIWSTHGGDGSWNYRTTTSQGSYSGNTREDSWTGTINIVTSSTPSDEYYLNYYFESWYSGGEGNHYLPGNSGKSKLHYKVLPPNPSSISVSATSGSIGGSGTENAPYLVQYNGSLSLSASGTRSFNDPNSSLYVKYGNASYSSTATKTISSITSTDAQYIDVEIKYYNSSAELSSATPRTQRVYYKVASYAITLDDNGTYQEDGSATAAYLRSTLTGITAPQRTGYHVDGYYGEAGLTTHISDASGNLQANKTVSSTAYTNGSSQWVKQSATTLYAKWAANTYDINLNANGGSGVAKVVTVTYDASLPTTLKGGGALTAHTRTGYNFAGYWDNTTSGTKYYNADLSTNTNWNKTTAAPLYAHWSAKSYTVTLDKQTSAEGYGGNTGTIGNQTVTYDAALPALSGTMPTAANGYAFMGFYSKAGGAGTKFINANGTWAVTNVTDTVSSGTWVKDGGITLYAYYKKAEITALTLVDAIVAQSVTNGVKVTPTIEPTPAGTTHIDWRVLYSNGNPLASQPSMTVYNTTGVQFTSPETSGTYLIEAVLRTGSTANAGTKLDSTTASFQVAGAHTVTIRYQDASGNTIQAPGSVTGRPLAWSDDITAPDIFGYTFARWDAGDGVTIKNGDSDPVTTSTDATIKIKAVYDGRLTAVYNKKQMIYFKDTLGWGNVYVNFMSASYWNAYNGSGNSNNYHSRNNQMSLVPGTTNVYYFEYTGSSTAYVSFTSKSQDNKGNFWESDASGNVAVCYPTKYDDSGSENSYYGLNWGTPMFVPLSDQTPIKKNISSDGGANYYNKGYWRYYDPVRGEEGGTGYTLKIYNKTEDDGRVELSSTTFTNADVTGQLFKATVNLEAAGGYGVKILRNNSMLYTNASGHLHRTGDVVVTDRQDDNYKAIWIKATAAGDYDFIITCNGDGKICLQATFPAKTGDYRVLYTDNASWSQTSNHVAQTWFHPSRVISAEANAEDTISFYVAKGNTPQYKIEKITGIDEGTGAITWTQVQGWTDISVAATGVYNFKITQNAAGDGISSVTNIGEYTGNYYIRTDCAGSTKWDNYKTADHMMTYSEYSKEHSDYTHYYMKFVESGTNVKFTIANDYSACISDTIITHNYRGGDASHVYAVAEGGHKAGDIKADANIRFMWDIRNNKLIRAYLARGKNDGSKFLVLAGTGSDNILDPSGNALSDETNNNHQGGDHCMQFVDNENWIYETNVKIVPSSYVKLTALFNGSTFYFKGSEGAFDETHAIKLIEGSGDAQLVRVIYDFKTDRLVAAWQPSGEISGERAIHADVMFVREHQGDIAQLTFTEGGAITEINTAYAVMRFNKWTINNKSKADGHAVLNPLLSRYERDLFYVSFPFRVSMNEVFGFGTYGQHWIIEEYDGAGRASKGFWADSESFWTFVTDRRGKFFEPNQGYIIALDLDEMGESSDVWDNGVEQVELYFPSYGTMGSITNSTVTYELDAHTCTIGPRFEGGDDRRIADSHWNVMSVPTYVNTSNVEFANTAWNTANSRPNFLYEWNSNDNSLTARSSDGYTYHAMHAYMVQYSGNVTWTTSVTPASIVARRTYAEAPSEVEFRLELSQNEKMADQTFVKLSNDEEVSAEFVFGEDMSKEFNKNKANIYTMVSTMIDGDLSITKTAGNTLPMINQTTIVPVGVKIAADGDYTFAIPEGTYGVGVTLIDNETGARTNLGLMDYTVNLSEGQIDNRFWLEISPIAQSPTGIDQSQMTNDQSQIKKVMIDGLLYIVKDGKVFDARGSRVK